MQYQGSIFISSFRKELYLPWLSHMGQVHSPLSWILSHTLELAGVTQNVLSQDIVPRNRRIL